MSKDTGGPAFPRNILDHGHGVTSQHESGMTLRDYFAAKAMQGLQANPAGDVLAMGYVEVANFSYRMADAMIAERNRES